MPSQRVPPDIWHAAQGNRVLPLPIPQHRDQQSHGDKSAPSDAAVYPQKVLHHSFWGGGGGPEVVHVPQQKLRHAAVRQNDARNAHLVTKHCRQPGGGIGNQTGRSERIENDKTQGTPMFPGTR